MSRWRKYQEQSYNLESKRDNSVPTWEKRFCFVVGSVPWKRFLEAKKYISESDKVMQWNDSAGEKAFHDAKKRFWAKINGLPSKISLLSPDIYIDKIDWDSKIDPKLLLGLDVASDEVGVDEGKNSGIENSCQLLSLDQIKPTGWDVSYSDIFNQPKLLTGMVVGDCGGRENYNGVNSWGCSNFLDDENLKNKTTTNGASSATIDYNSWEKSANVILNWNEQYNIDDNDRMGLGKKNENYRRRVGGNGGKSSRCMNSRFRAYKHQRNVWVEK